MAKFAQPVNLPKVGKVIVMVHNVEDKDEAIDLLEKAMPLNAADIQEYEGNKFLHLNSGLGFADKISFTKTAADAGSSTSCIGEWV
jgi:hypothetical protein